MLTTGGRTRPLGRRVAMDVRPTNSVKIVRAWLISPTHDALFRFVPFTRVAIFRDCRGSGALLGLAHIAKSLLGLSVFGANLLVYPSSFVGNNSRTIRERQRLGVGWCIHSGLVRASTESFSASMTRWVISGVSPTKDSVLTKCGRRWHMSESSSRMTNRSGVPFSSIHS